MVLTDRGEMKETLEFDKLDNDCFGTYLLIYLPHAPGIFGQMSPRRTVGAFSLPLSNLFIKVKKQLKCRKNSFQGLPKCFLGGDCVGTNTAKLILL